MVALAEYISLDTETTLIEDEGVVPTLVCTSYAAGDDVRLYLADQTSDMLLPLLRDNDKHIIFHNAPFDILALSKATPAAWPLFVKALQTGRIHDTMLRAQMIRHACGVPCNSKPSLDELAKEVGIELDKDPEVRLKYGTLLGKPLSEWPDRFVTYAKDDARATDKVFRKQQRLAELLEDESIHLEYYVWKYLATRKGLRLDRQQVEAVRQEAIRKVDELLPPLLSKQFLRLEPDDPDGVSISRPIWMRPVIQRDRVRDEVIKQLDKKNHQLYVSKTGMKALRYFKYPQSKTDLSDSAKAFVRSCTDERQIREKYVSTEGYVCEVAGTPSLKKFSEYTSVSNMLDNDIKNFMDVLETGEYVHTNINPMLSTGRTSSSSPPMQNKRADGPIRSCFIPRDGNVFITVDYGSAELHTFAQTCINLFGESQLAEMLNKGMDIHSFLGAAILGTDYETFVSKKELKKYKNVRNLAKVKIYGSLGFQGPIGFVPYAAKKGVFISLEESMELHKTFLATFLDAPRYFDLAKQEEGSTINIPGTRRYRFVSTATEAANTKFQGMAADPCKTSFTEISRQAYLDRSSRLYGTLPLLTIHDEILLESPKDRADEVLACVEDIMRVEFNKLTPDVPVKVEGKVMERWVK